LDPLALVVAAIGNLNDADRQTVAALLVRKGGAPSEAEPADRRGRVREQGRRATSKRQHPGNRAG